jgi:peptidoglycan hydrolase-like protein with peptidoglycan-binding domain
MADGVVGPQTQGAMRALRAETEPTGIGEEDDDTRESADDEARERTLVLFDPADADQVKAFQRAHGLGADGCIGPRTQAALAAVIREHELELRDSDLPRPERKPRARRPGRGFVAVGGLGASSFVAGEDKDFDRELDDLLDAMRERDAMSRTELREATHACRWGPGRFRYVLDSAEEEGLVRRIGRDRYTVADR